jgi:hypothetical protein
MLIADVSNIAETLVASLILLGSLICGFFIIRGWIRGEPTGREWEGGGTVSRLWLLCGSAWAFFLSLAFILHSLWLLIPALAVWIIGYRSCCIANKKYKMMRTAIREENASKYPEVFQVPAPDLDTDELPHQPSFRIFDDITASYLGELSRDQLQFIIRSLGPNIEGEKYNNFFILTEVLDTMEKDGADPKMIELLRKAEAKQEIILRWASQ